jgi:hypothetical protein
MHQSLSTPPPPSHLCSSHSPLLPTPHLLQPAILPHRAPAHAECFTPPITAPLTSLQFILSSSSSSTNPTTATLSPRTIYKPCCTILELSSSSGGRMMRSCVCPMTCYSSSDAAGWGRLGQERAGQGTYEIRHLVARQQRADQRARVARQHDDFL